MHQWGKRMADDPAMVDAARGGHRGLVGRERACRLCLAAAVFVLILVLLVITDAVLVAAGDVSYAETRVTLATRLQCGAIGLAVFCLEIGSDGRLGLWLCRWLAQHVRGRRAIPRDTGGIRTERTDGPAQ
jgi:hypothetical protein